MHKSRHSVQHSSKLPPSQLSISPEQMQAELNELKSKKFSQSRFSPVQATLAKNENLGIKIFKKPHVPKALHKLLTPILPQSYLIG